MSTITTSQMQDALHIANGLANTIKTLPKGEEWGGGLRLWMPNVIALRPDYDGEGPIVWLVSNDFEGYDITTVAPKKESGA